MSWHTVETPNKVMEIVHHVISKKKEIKIKVTGSDELFGSLILELNRTHQEESAGKDEKLIIDRLEPSKANELIHVNPEIEVEFTINQKSFRFASTFLGVNHAQEPFGLFISVPDSIDFQNTRANERYTYEVPEFVAAEFKLGKGTANEKSYELGVLDCSIKGLGLLVEEENMDLMKKLKTGDEIEEIFFYTSWMMMSVTGTVKHMTKIDTGKYKGKYVMGIESRDLIKSCRKKRQG